MFDRVRSPGGERGQAVPLVVGAVAVLAVLLAALGWFARSSIDAARARTAADAAALAGVVGGREQAGRLAAANGGVLVAFERRGADVVVRVRVGRATASARATGSPPVARAGWSQVGALHRDSGRTLLAHGRARPSG